MSLRAKKLISAAVFAVLWTLGMLWWAHSFELETIILTVVSGLFAGLLWYFLADKFSARFRS